jgi:autotransporter adhesin
MQAALGAAELAKGLALVAASGDDADAAMVKNVVQAQGMFNVARGGAQTAMAAGASGPQAAVAAAAIATAVALRQLTIAIREQDKAILASNTFYRSTQVEAANASVGRHVGQDVADVECDARFLWECDRGTTNQRNRSSQWKRPSDQRQGANQPSDFGFKQEIRARRERAQGIEEQKDVGCKMRCVHVRDQAGSDGLALAANWGPIVRRRKQAHERKLAALRKEFRSTGHNRAGSE